MNIPSVTKDSTTALDADQVKKLVKAHYAAAAAVEKSFEAKGHDLGEARQLEAKQEPKYLVSAYDKRVYSNPSTSENGQLVKVGVLIEHTGKDGKLVQDIIPTTDEPANKKERRKQRAGLPFRTKCGNLTRARP